MQCVLFTDPPVLLQGEGIHAPQIKIFNELPTARQTEVMIRYLAQGLNYSISIAANNGAGRGSCSDEVIMECKVEDCVLVLKEGELALCRKSPEPNRIVSSTSAHDTSFAYMLFGSVATDILVLVFVVELVVLVVVVVVVLSVYGTDTLDAWRGLFTVAVVLVLSYPRRQ